MGSEQPKSITVHVTGFSKFQGVASNPTETLVNNLKNYVENRGLPAGLKLGSCSILETAGDGALPRLNQILDSNTSKTNAEGNGHVVWLHLGVNNGASEFSVERLAANEATFCCPDELGWQPQLLPIVPEDGEISQTRETSCPVEDILGFLNKRGYDVIMSDDAGRFVCNYVYYHSLRYAEEKGHKSLFVHVPSFLEVDEETQMSFIASLFDAIASTC